MLNISYVHAKSMESRHVRLRKMEETKGKRLEELSEAMAEVRERIAEISKGCAGNVKILLETALDFIAMDREDKRSEWAVVRDANNAAIVLDFAADLSMEGGARGSAKQLFECAGKLYGKLGMIYANADQASSPLGVWDKNPLLPF